MIELLALLFKENGLSIKHNFVDTVCLVVKNFQDSSIIFQNNYRKKKTKSICSKPAYRKSHSSFLCNFTENL